MRSGSPNGGVAVRCRGAERGNYPFAALSVAPPFEVACFAIRHASLIAASSTGTSRGALLVLAVTTTALAVASLVGELAAPSGAEHVVAGAALAAVFVAVILVYFMARRG
jgi:hypothetical protein